MLHRIEGVGLPNVYLTTGFAIEGEGDAQLVSYFDLDGLHFAIARAVALRAAPLTSVEFRMLRRRLGLSQEQAGELVGKTSQAVAKWEKEKGPVPVADGKVMRLAWISKHSRRDILRAVDQILAAEGDPKGNYVFAFDGGKWHDDAHKSVFVPMAEMARAETAAVLVRFMVTSSANTGSAAVAVRLAPSTVLRVEKVVTT